MSALPFPDPALTHGSVLLRPWRESDVPAIVSACRDPEIPRFNQFVPPGYTEADAREWLDGLEPKRLEVQSLALAVAQADTDAVAGSIAATVNARQRLASVGYWLAPEARGKGYMTTAVRLLCGWLFDELAMDRVQLTTAPANRPSQAVASRCGFKQEGHLRSYLYYGYRDERSDALMWSLLPGELTRE
jgi:RimJ/RimL family protein N-acetyltransferase